MTDNEIITIDEAIKHCYEVAECKCDDCGKEHLQLAKWLEELKESREIINRQKAEVERLQGRVKSVEYSKQCLLECFKTAKSEARKEFVEGWHTALEEARTKFAYEPIIVRNAIEVVIAVTDNLLKEMESD